MRAAIYLRQSQDTHLDGLAVERQRIDCERLCAERGWQVVRTITDNDTSATKGHRAGYAELLALAETQAIQVLVCWHMDRLTRRPTELEDMIARCERTGLRVATVTGDYDLSTDEGRLIGRILTSVARGEVERKSARQKRAMLQAAEAGTVPSRRAFGYHTDGSHHPDEAPAARELFANVLAGMSVNGATKWLNERGMVTTTGRTWDWSSVRKLLLHPRYAGLRTLRGEVVGPGTWEPIISEDVHRAVVERLTDPARVTNHVGSARRWLGSGLFRCGKCGSLVRSNYDKNGQRAYMCRAHSHLSRKAEPIDAYVQRVVAERLRRPDLADLLAAETPDATPLRAEAATLRAKLDNMTSDYADGLLTARQLHQATEKVDARLGRVNAQLAEAGRATSLGWLAAAPDPAQAFLDAGLDTRRAVIDALLEVRLLAGKVGRAPFDPATVHIEWKGNK